MTDNTLSAPLKALIVEDEEDDALLLVDRLESMGYTLQWARVDSEPAMIQALEETWDIVFSDYSMPGFSGKRALELTRERNLDIPFIFVSGTIGEVAAVNAIKSGAQDYVMKNDLARLTPTIERELREVELRRKRRETEQELQRLITIVESTPDLVSIIEPDGRLRYLNRAGRQLLGIDTNSDLSEYSFNHFFQASDGHQYAAHILAVAAQQKAWKKETIIRDPLGEMTPFSLLILSHWNESGTLSFYSAIARDISERKRFEAELRHQATHDNLTNLPNRLLLKDSVVSAINKARQYHRHVAVFFLDMDNFKRVNDTLGHAAGDNLLQQAAFQLQSCLRPSDMLARHGGDEFTLVIGDMEHTDKVLSVLRNIQNAFEYPLSVDSHQVYVTFSAGIALYPHDGDTEEELMRNADTALHQAKASGANQYRFYAPDMNARGHERLSMEVGLRRALERNEFRLHYQPQVDLHTGKIIGFEGLLRWQHPLRGLLPPGEFIPVLENSGLIVPVGEWVVREACRQHRQWRDQGHPNRRISVNVSTVQFNDSDLLDKVKNALREEQMPDHQLELEITENMLMVDPENAAVVLQTLHDLGVRTAIDDFGTGYSSLAYLKRFPLDVLKIDQGFVRDLTHDPSDAAIVEASLSISQKLGLEIVAEGVETQAQIEFLRARGCNFAQGYYFSKPLPQDEASDLFQRQWPWDTTGS